MMSDPTREALEWALSVLDELVDSSDTTNPAYAERLTEARAALSTTHAPLDTLMKPVVAFLRGVAKTNDAALGIIEYIERDLPALSTTPAPLDVERLARALHRVQSAADGHGDPTAQPDESCRIDAEAIAREYAKP